MIKLLIVDDDEFIRKGLRQLILWDELGVEIIGEAENGKAAIEMVRTLHPHILLTDMNMPGGDGLELIESIRSLRLDTRIIILSGYNDFDLVRKAMKFQVEDYLLKPVNKYELSEIIKTIGSQFEQQWIQEQLQRESFQLLRNNILIRWVEKRIDSNQLEQKLDFLKLDLLHCNLFQVGIVLWRDLIEAPLAANEEKFRPFALLNVIEEMMQQENKGIAFLDNEKRVLCLFASNGENGRLFSEHNLHWLNNKANEISTMLKVPWFSTLGKVYCEPQQVHHSYHDAIKLLDFLNLTGAVHCIDESWLKNYDSSEVTSISDRTQIIQSLLANDSSWKQGFDLDFHWALAQNDPLASAKAIAVVWIVLIRQTLKEVKGKIAAPLNEIELIINLKNRDSVHDVRQSLLQTLLKVEGFLQEKTSIYSHSIISRVERYVLDHLDKELSLKQLAIQFNYNNTHLGRLFKEETGEYFSDYLNKARIEKAKALLIDSLHKAGEISKLVGFSDANYFYKKFKELTNMSPIEYRNSKQG